MDARFAENLVRNWQNVKSQALGPDHSLGKLSEVSFSQAEFMDGTYNFVQYVMHFQNFFSFTSLVSNPRNKQNVYTTFTTVSFHALLYHDCSDSIMISFL